MPRLLLALLALSLSAYAFELPRSSTQCIVGIAENWNSSHATLQFHQKTKGQWQPVGPSIPARLGKSGLAWGLGLHPTPSGATLKKEGDWKAPAGVFTLGGAWGYAPNIKRHTKLPYRRVTPRDLWIEDPQHTAYNRHLILPHNPQSAWEKKQQMKQTDPAHALKLFIDHNAPPKVTPGMGSSIFFHIWRSGGTKPTAGCTTLAKPELENLIAKIDPSQKPLYILLPQAEYDHLRKSWKLP
jgi:L,D-peptidoglycan transpeptidase YkuD (ErfK/YbiS/YcfS/YnhG family)